MKKKMTKTDFSHALATAIKHKFDPSKGTLTGFIAAWLRFVELVD